MQIPIPILSFSPERIELAFLLRRLQAGDLSKLFCEFQAPARNANEDIAACKIRAEILEAWDGGDRDTRERLLRNARRYANSRSAFARMR